MLRMFGRLVASTARLGYRARSAEPSAKLVRFGPRFGRIGPIRSYWANSVVFGNLLVDSARMVKLGQIWVGSGQTWPDFGQTLAHIGQVGRMWANLLPDLIHLGQNVA